MVYNQFFKAALLTAVIVFFSFFLAYIIDSTRTGEVKSFVQDLIFESESNRLISKFYLFAANSTKKCEILQIPKEVQTAKTYQLALKFKEYEQANLFNTELEYLKKSYFVNLFDLYLLALEKNNACPENKDVIVVFFYLEAACPACIETDYIIRNVTANCQNIQTFAFPLNVNYSFIKALKNYYALEDEPTLVINNKKYSITNLTEEKLLTLLKLEQAICK
ncbi:MAG: hypothetical protein N3D10_00740 [Candidatus Micrarchaeota archaeon]|nr:hypothetical protein [Candidatus Micrarchaeota archaeon]